MAKRSSEQCEMDMTPMIDVVFQLIIFFVVTLKMTADVNPDIKLEDGKHGVVMTQENMPPSTFEIEIDRKGRISLHNATCTELQLFQLIKARVNKYGDKFPCLIRADRRTHHEKIKKVMDLCTRAGIWKLSFVAVKEHKAGSKQR